MLGDQLSAELREDVDHRIQGLRRAHDSQAWPTGQTTMRWTIPPYTPGHHGAA